MHTKILKEDAYLIKGFVNPSLFDTILEETRELLKCQLTWSKGWPARATQDHKMARVGDNGITYSFKDKVKPVHPWTPTTILLRDEINDELNWKSNCCVINTYTPNGDLHPHRDSQYITELGSRPTICSLSFGAPRTFLLFPLDEKGKRSKNPIEILLEPGDMLVMQGDCDEKYHHGIKPENVDGLRLSLTYRKHYNNLN